MTDNSSVLPDGDRPECDAGQDAARADRLKEAGLAVEPDGAALRLAVDQRTLTSGSDQLALHGRGAGPHGRPARGPVARCAYRHPGRVPHDRTLT